MHRMWGAAWQHPRAAAAAAPVAMGLLLALHLYLWLPLPVAAAAHAGSARPTTDKVCAVFIPYIALQLGKAAVVSGSVFVIFKVVKTITPLPVRHTQNSNLELKVDSAQFKYYLC